MFRAKRYRDTIKNLEAQLKDLWAQNVAAAREFERRYAAMQRDRDYWREQAGGNEL